MARAPNTMKYNGCVSGVKCKEEINRLLAKLAREVGVSEALLLENPEFNSTLALLEARPPQLRRIVVPQANETDFEAMAKAVATSSRRMRRALKQEVALPQLDILYASAGSVVDGELFLEPAAADDDNDGGGAALIFHDGMTKWNTQLRDPRGSVTCSSTADDVRQYIGAFERSNYDTLILAVTVSVRCEVGGPKKVLRDILAECHRVARREGVSLKLRKKRLYKSMLFFALEVRKMCHDLCSCCGQAGKLVACGHCGADFCRRGACLEPMRELCRPCDFEKLINAKRYPKLDDVDFVCGRCHSHSKSQGSKKRPTAMMPSFGGVMALAA